MDAWNVSPPGFPKQELILYLCDLLLVVSFLLGSVFKVVDKGAIGFFHKRESNYK